MEIIKIVLLFFFGFVLGRIVVLVRGFFRVDKVFEFRQSITKMIFKDGRNVLKRVDILYNYPFGKMVDSWKPLKLESFFTKEEIDILMGVKE